MAIASKMEADIRGMRQAQRNTVDGISLVQTAEGGLNEISAILMRLKELGVQSASDTIGVAERQYLQKEFGALKDEIDRIAASTEFNGTKLLMGDLSELDPELRANSNMPPLEIQVGHTFDPALDAASIPKPVNIIRVDLRKINALTDGPGSLSLGNGGTENETRVDTKADAQMSLQRLDDALGKVNDYRATLGAIQNRLGSAHNATSIQIENISAAKSRIKDADFAEEMAHVVQNRILQQSGVSVLAQANELPQLALKLLNG